MPNGNSYTSNFNSQLIRLTIIFFKFIPLVALYFLFLHVSIRYFEDANNLVEDHIVEFNLNQNSNVEVETLGGKNERILQKKIIQHVTHRDLAVFGSSKSYGIGKNILPDFDLQNHAMSSSHLEDFLGLINIYLNKSNRPKYILLGLDAEAFNDENSNELFNGGAIFWDVLRPDILQMYDRLEISSKKRLYKPAILRQHFSWIFPKQLQIYLDLWIKEFSGYNLLFEPKKTNLTEGVKSVISADGHRSWPLAQREVSQNWTDSHANSYSTENYVYFLGHYNQISPSAKEILEKLVQYLHKENIKIAFFISPYHPVAYENLIKRADTKIILDFENYIQMISKKLGVQVIGSINPAKAGVDSTDFIDGYHMRNSGLEKIFKNTPLEFQN